MFPLRAIIALVVPQPAHTGRPVRPGHGATLDRNWTVPHRLSDCAYEDAAQPGRTGLRPDIRMARDIARQAEKSLRHTEAWTDVSQDGTSTRSVLVRHGTQRKQVDCCSRVFLSERKHEGSPYDGYYLSSSSPTHRLRALVIALANQPIPFRAEIVWLDGSLL